MNEPSGKTTKVPSASAEAAGATPSRSSFWRVLRLLAATVIVLAGIRLAAPVLNIVFFTLVLSLLFGPVYAWIRGLGIPKPLALVVMLILLVILFGGLFYILGASIARFRAGLGTYTAELNAQLASARALAEQLGLSNVGVRDVVRPNAIVGAVGGVLAGVVAFLKNFFLILMIVLFLLAEGPALMSRLRASTSEGHPQVARLATVGESVVRQFGLRAIVNLATSAGATVLLFLLGVDFALMWGILAFFLCFIPWIGLPLAIAPAVVLALLEHGVTRAVLVIVGVTVINTVAEDVLSPLLMGRGLSLSPTVVFVSFVFWAWLLGGPGAFLALPITLFVAVMLDTFAETRWLANLVGISSPEVESEAPP